MRALVTWSSRRGGTEGIGRIVADAIQTYGLDAVAAPIDQIDRLESFDAVIIGGALYANHWPHKLRTFVSRHVAQLRKVPVWFFSSGPLGDAADDQAIPAPTQVAILAERIGAKGHVTFGGRLAPDATGFPASAMARKKSGDWRNPNRIREWAAELAAQIPTATPGRPIEHPAHSLSCLLIYAVAGWALCAVTMFILQNLVSLTAALAIQAIAAPLFFTAIAHRYFRARGAREPAAVAVAWTATVAMLDLIVVAGAVQHSLAMFASIAGTWLPLALIFLVTWITGEVMSMVPETRHP